MLADEWKPGDLFADRYQIARLLGKGGMGAVYLAKDTRLGREVALKLPLIRPGSPEKLASRFVVEARAAAALSHPNICQVFEAHEFEGHPYLTMDYIAGEPLDKLLGRESPLPPERAVSIIRDLARALDRAHSKGIVHRDLKPSNVLLCPDRGAVLTDFGLARFLEDSAHLTSVGVMMGTYAYMSPEHCHGDSNAIGPASDVFSLGIIFYELLTGRRPFQGSTEIALMYQIAMATPRPPSAIIAGLDPRLDEVCLKALAKPVIDRFASMAALIADLPTGTLVYGPVPETLVEVVPTLPKTVPDSIGMTLVRIEPGSFLMGSPDSDDWAEADEKPQHEVFITKPFDIGATQVTVGQFRRFVEATKGYKTDAEKDVKGGYGWDELAGKFEQAPKYTWRNPGFVQDDDHPVVNVSWNDAVAFCDWLSKEEGADYRLPTEAEWEYACRAGTTTRYQHGDDPEGLAPVGNVADATLKSKYPNVVAIRASDGALYTAAVGRYRANAGLYDMHGNVLEWCSDWYEPGYYSKSIALDPPGLPQANGRVIRGGGWFSGPRYARSAFRFWLAPGSRSSNLGFRVARVLSR